MAMTKLVNKKDPFNSVEIEFHTKNYVIAIMDEKSWIVICGT